MPFFSELFFSAGLTEYLKPHMGCFAIVAAVAVPSYITLFPYIDKYALDMLGDKYSWLFAMACTLCNLIVSFFSDKRYKDIQRKLRDYETRLGTVENIVLPTERANNWPLGELSTS